MEYQGMLTNFINFSLSIVLKDELNSRMYLFVNNDLHFRLICRKFFPAMQFSQTYSVKNMYQTF